MITKSTSDKYSWAQDQNSCLTHNRTWYVREVDGTYYARKGGEAYYEITDYPNLTPDQFAIELNYKDHVQRLTKEEYSQIVHEDRPFARTVVNSKDKFQWYILDKGLVRNLYAGMKQGWHDGNYYLKVDVPLTEEEMQAEVDAFLAQEKEAKKIEEITQQEYWKHFDTKTTCSTTDAKCYTWEEGGSTYARTGPANQKEGGSRYFKLPLTPKEEVRAHLDAFLEKAKPIREITRAEYSKALYGGSRSYPFDKRGHNQGFNIWYMPNDSSHVDQYVGGLYGYPLSSRYFTCTDVLLTADEIIRRVEAFVKEQEGETEGPQVVESVEVKPQWVVVDSKYIVDLHKCTSYELTENATHYLTEDGHWFRLDTSITEYHLSDPKRIVAQLVRRHKEIPSVLESTFKEMQNWQWENFRESSGTRRSTLSTVND